MKHAVALLLAVFVLAFGTSAHSQCVILKRMGPADQITSHMYSFGVRGKQFQFVEGRLPSSVKFHGRLTDNDVRKIQNAGATVLIMEPKYTAPDLVEARKGCIVSVPAPAQAVPAPTPAPAAVAVPDSPTPAPAAAAVMPATAERAKVGTVLPVQPQPTTAVASVVPATAPPASEGAKRNVSTSLRQVAS
jgi:hypothetical protein